MPNTKSAERRVRNSARKQLRNLGIRSRLSTMAKNYLEIVKSGNKEAAVVALRAVSSTLDKAAKSGVVHKATANRRKSRLALHLNRAK